MVSPAKSWVTWLVLTTPREAIRCGASFDSATSEAPSSRVTLPVSARVERMMSRIRVVFPAPLGPMRPSTGWAPSTKSSTCTTV